MSTITFTDTLIVEHCCTCGMAFGMTTEFKDRMRQVKKFFYCPAGHPQYYSGETEETKLRRELQAKENALAAERSRKDQLAAELRDTRETSKREKAALKGSLTKMKNRVGRGVCPCCNRTFQDLHRHMNTKHPEFANSEATT